MTVTDELKKYSLVALVVVIAYQVIGIILAALLGSQMERRFSRPQRGRGAFL